MWWISPIDLTRRSWQNGLARQQTANTDPCVLVKELEGDILGDDKGGGGGIEYQIGFHRDECFWADIVVGGEIVLCAHDCIMSHHIFSGAISDGEAAVIVCEDIIQLLFSHEWEGMFHKVAIDGDCNLPHCIQ